MSTKSSVPLSAGISAGTVSPNRSWAMCSGAYSSPSNATKGSTQPSAGWVVEAVAPVLAVHPGQPAHTVGHLVDRHRPGRVAGVGAARDDVLHDHQEVAALLVDDRGVDRWMVKRQNDSRAEQPRLVIQPAGQCDEVGVLGIDRLREHRCGPVARGVCQLPAGHAGWCRRRAARPRHRSTVAPGK